MKAIQRRTSLVSDVGSYPFYNPRRRLANESSLISLQEQRKLVDHLASKLKIQQFADWYQISSVAFRRVGGTALLRQHKSLHKVLSSVYSEIKWNPNKFTSSPDSVTRRRTKDLKTISQMEQRLGIQKPEDWLTVRLSDLRELGLSKRIRLVYLADLLKEKYPDRSWEQIYLMRGKYALQRRLEKAVQVLFPGVEIKINARKEAGIIDPDTNNYMELDIYIPSLHLAFEFQEKHHYLKGGSFVDKSLEELQAKDKLKKELSEKQGISLVIVPCWWDFGVNSLAASIKAVRKDLESKMISVIDAEPIPDVPPADFFSPHIDTIEDIGEPTTACFFTKKQSDPSNWWMFEKYDGVRGFWHPTKKAFYSRRGKKFTFPQHVIDAMPSDLFLDGELWFGRENFQEAMKISNRVDASEIDWNKFKFMVFDIPSLRLSYSERYQALAKALEGRDCRYIEIAPYETCKDASHLEQFFQDIIDRGGEGIILRDPNCPYQPGNSSGYLKHKKFRDAEARVVSEIGTATWECELPNGVRFTAPAGTSEFARRYKPQSGDIVSFKHRGFLASQKPKFPTVYRIRTDISWDDVVKHHKEKRALPKKVPEIRRTKKQKPKGFWNDIENRRKFFLEFADDKGFDPYSTQNWQQVTYADILAKNGGARVLSKSNGLLYKALEECFPKLKFQGKTRPQGYWKNIENRKKFFLQVAEELGFDPYKASNWENVTTAQIRQRKGGTLLKNYGGLQAALESTFPDMQFVIEFH